MNVVRSVTLLALCAAGVAARQAPVVPVSQSGQAGQTPPAAVKGNGIVTGRVVDARGTGVAGAIVTLQGGWQAIALTTVNRELPNGSRFTITNADGHFVFFDLAPGTYAFEANKPGFIAGAYGRLRPGGQPQSIDLKDGDRPLSLRIPIWEYASVGGTVRDEAGEPLVGVQVRALRHAMVFGRWQWTGASAGTTNDRGEYRIDALTPGQYVIAVASTQTSMPIDTGAAAPSQEIQIQLARAGVSYSSMSGREIGGWLWSSGSTTGAAVPNPGVDGRLAVYPTTFYPAARSIRSAESIVLESGQERLGVDLQLQLVPTTTIAGVVLGADGALAGQSVRLVPEYAAELSGDLRGFDTAASVSDASGRIFFVGVAPGQYYAQAEVQGPFGDPSAVPSTSVGRWLNDPVTVSDSGLAGITWTLRPAVKVTGRIAFNGTKPTPAPDLIARFSVSLEPLGFAVNRVEAPYLVNFDRNGQFVFPAVPPGPYIITFRAAVPDRRAMPDWETQGATLDGQDVSDHPMTITTDVNGIVMTLTDHNSELNGTVRDAGGKADPTAAILLFTADRDLWPLRMTRRIRALRASETGTYAVRGVPPGEHFLVAIPDVDIGDFPDPRMLEALTKSATRFVMAPSERRTQDLTLKAIK